MNWLKLSVILFIFSASFAQDRGIPLGTFFKDQSLFSDSSFTPIFPISTGDAAVFKQLQDTQKRYSTFSYYLFQRELIEVHKPEGNLWITPIFDIQLGAERGDTSLRQFYNVRGARLEATLGKHFFVSTSFYENQAFLPNYVREYANKRGEYYPNSADSSYSQVNAFIPNGARTKPFKEGGFDYAYASGYLRWDIKKWLTVSGGNQPLFVGSGYRSLIYSDNTAPSIFGRVQLKLGKLIDYQLIRGQAMNLLRLPYAANGEALYERKGFSINSIYFKIGKRIQLGLIETALWTRGDSLQKQAVEGGFYIPLPGGGLLQETINGKAFALTAIDFQMRISKLMGLYAQFGTHKLDQNSELVQIGLRLWPFKSPDYLIQVEFNHTGKNAYRANNPRLNYSTYNMPLGHIMGYGVDELIIRLQGTYKKCFLNLFSSIYFNQNSNRDFLLPVYNGSLYNAQQVLNQKLEIGYRFNATYAFEVFGSLQYRLANSAENTTSYWANIGLRMNLNNHYFDF